MGVNRYAAEDDRETVTIGSVTIELTSCASILRSSGSRSNAFVRCARRAMGRHGKRRSMPSAPRRATGRTSCRRSFRPSRLAPPSARFPTRCAPCSASTRKSMAEPGARGRIPTACRRTPHDRLRCERPLRPRGHRRQLRFTSGRNPLPCRRIGQRQVAHRALDHASRPAAGTNHGWTHLVSRPGSAHACPSVRCSQSAAPRSVSSFRNR